MVKCENMIRIYIIGDKPLGSLNLLIQNINPVSAALFPHIRRRAQNEHICSP